MRENGFYKIILADDHEVFRIGLRTLIATDSSLRIVGEASDGNKILQLLDVIACDLIILDLWMPNMDGFAILDELSARYPQVKRLVLSMDFTTESVRKVLSKGVNGFITKEDVASIINTAIQTIREEKHYYSPDIQAFILEHYNTISNDQQPLDHITDREKEVAGLVGLGLTNKEISLELHISVYTVQFHRSNLMRKLKLKNAADLIRFAMYHNLSPAR